LAKLRTATACLLVLGVLSPSALSAWPAERKLLWPLDARIAVTSSFCDYRPFRFHAGFDLSTGGRIGVPVFAVDNGYVWRVRVSPYGYGKALYLRLDDGRTTVYGHLDRFGDAVEHLVLQEQMRCETYTVDLFLTPRQVRVRRGEVIAYSGKTGIGAPHLHFEIRDAQNRPLNPFANGFEFSDAIPPTMVSLAFIPLDGDARANESLDPLIVPLANYDGVWTSKSVPMLWGRIGVALAAWDRIPYGRYRLGIQATTMAVNGTEVFARRYDRMSLANEHLSVFDRNFLLLATGEGRYYNLYLPSANYLPFYDDLPIGAGVLACGVESPADSALSLPAGRHELTFAALDFNGNRARGRLSFAVGRSPQITEVMLNDSAGTPWFHVIARDSGDAIRLTATASADGRRTWRPLPGAREDSSGAAGRARLSVPLPNDSLVLRVVAEDASGDRTTQVVTPSSLKAPPRIALKCTWGRDWCVLDVGSSRPLRRLPSITATWPVEVMVRLEPTEVSPGLFEADVVPGPTWPKNYKVRVLAGSDRPTIVTQWVGEHRLAGVVESVPSRDTLSAFYRGVVIFRDAFPDSGFLRLIAEDMDTTFVVRGRLLGPFGGQYARPDLGASVEFGRGVIAEPLFVRLETKSLPAFRELEPIGQAYVFEPQCDPLAGEATIMVHVPDTLDLAGVALYGISPKRASCIAVPEESFNHTLQARVRSLPTVGLYRDTTPPSIQFISPRPNALLSNRTPSILAAVNDHGSGFAKSDDAMEMRLDGNWVPAAYDPEADTFHYQPTTPLAPGQHTVVIHARDQVGNSQSSTIEFTIE